MCAISALILEHCHQRSFSLLRATIQCVQRRRLSQSQVLSERPHFSWNSRGLTMPASTLGSWEAMTSDIISGNSTFMASAWMKVLRQYRLTFLTICGRKTRLRHGQPTGSPFFSLPCRSARARLPRAWRPSAWWDGRTSGNWPPNSSLWRGWPWSAPGCTAASSVQTLPDFWVPREALQTPREKLESNTLCTLKSDAIHQPVVRFKEAPRKHQLRVNSLFISLVTVLVNFTPPKKNH